MSKEKKQSFIGGTMILAIAVAVVKVIGALYKIPLGNILGTEGMTHFNSAYNIYSVLLSISTAGLPLAVSKLVSEARALGRYNQSRKVLSVAMWLFVVLGAAGTSLMFFWAEPLAAAMNNTLAYWPIRALSVSVVCVCVMSAFRGYTQGQGNMMPSAISQVIEAAFKLVVGLLLAWYFVSAGLGVDIGAAGAILGVTAGSVVAMVYMLLHQLRSRRDDPDSADRPSGRKVILKRLLAIGVPITIGASGQSIISTLDQSIAMGRLQDVLGIGEKAAAALYGEYSFGMTLFNFPSSFIPPITMSLIPAVAAAVARRDHRTVNRVVSASFRLIALLALPAGVGLSVMAGPILKMLYPAQPEAAAAATYHLQILGIASIFVCLTLLTNGILQANDRAKIPIVTIIIGGCTKVALNYILIGVPGINIKGAPIGTLACYVLISVINLTIVYRIVEEKPRYLRLFGKPLAASVLMGLGAHYAYAFFSGRFGNTLSTVGAIGVAVVVYLVLVVTLRIITREDLEMVPKGDKLAKLLRIR